MMIRWSLQRGFVCIPKTSKEQRVVENTDVFDFNITKEDMQTLVNPMWKLFVYICFCALCHICYVFPPVDEIGRTLNHRLANCNDSSLGTLRKKFVCMVRRNIQKCSIVYSNFMTPVAVQSKWKLFYVQACMSPLVAESPPTSCICSSVAIIISPQRKLSVATCITSGEVGQGWPLVTGPSYEYRFKNWVTLSKSPES